MHSCRVGGQAELSRNSTQKAMHEALMEQVVREANATQAWLAVKRNRGCAGIDGMTTEELRSTIRVPCSNRACSHPVKRKKEAAAFNRRMRKTARPVVWEGAGAQSPALDPILHGHGFSEIAIRLLLWKKVEGARCNRKSSRLRWYRA